MRKFSLQMEKRNVTRGREILIRMAAFLLALAAGAVLIRCNGHSPFFVYADMVWGALGRVTFVRETIKAVIPLIIVSTALAISFRMGFWNIGGEGQMLIGAAVATSVAIYGENELPHAVLLLCMCIVAVVGAGIYGAIPAFCKAQWNTNETLLTLMMNYIALEFIILLQNTTSWQDPNNAFPQIRALSDNARLPEVLGIHIGWIAAPAVLAFYWFYMEHTRHGYEIRVVGDSCATAHYAGINSKWVIVRSIFLSAAMCGLAGFIQVSGADGTLSDTTAGGIGFTAIAIVWLAQMKPWEIAIFSFLIAIMEQGANRIQTDYQIPTSFAGLLEGIILLIMMASAFFINYRVFIHREEAAV